MRTWADRFPPTKLVAAQVPWIFTVCPPGLEGFPRLAYSWSSEALVCLALSAHLWMVWGWLRGLHKWHQITTVQTAAMSQCEGCEHTRHTVLCYTISRHRFTDYSPWRCSHWMFFSFSKYSASQKSQPCCIKAMSNAPAPKEKAKKSRKHDTQSWAAEKHVYLQGFGKKCSRWFANLQSCHADLLAWCTMMLRSGLIQHTPDHH